MPKHIFNSYRGMIFVSHIFDILLVIHLWLSIYLLLFHINFSKQLVKGCPITTTATKKHFNVASYSYNNNNNKHKKYPPVKDYKIVIVGARPALNKKLSLIGE